MLCIPLSAHGKTHVRRSAITGTGVRYVTETFRKNEDRKVDKDDTGHGLADTLEGEKVASGSFRIECATSLGAVSATFEN